MRIAYLAVNCPGTVYNTNDYSVERITVEPMLERSQWDQSLLSIGAALDRLHFLASAIRKASSKKALGEEVLLNLATEEEVMFKKTAIAYVKWKFPKARTSLREHLGFDIAARRKLMSKKNHHAKKLAARRKYLTSSGSDAAWLDQSVGAPEASETQETLPIPRERSPLPERPVAGTEVTRASTLDPNLVAKYIHHNKPTLSIRSTGTSRRDDALTQRYPQLPKITAGERHVPCPYCRKPLRADELRGSKGTEFWEYALRLLPK